jgi:hypothetical protein
VPEQKNPRVSVALEDGLHPVIWEATGRLVASPYEEAILELFKRKNSWNLAIKKQ